MNRLQININHKNFAVYSWVLWLGLFISYSFLELLKNNWQLKSNLIYYPGAHFLALAILTPFAVHFFRLWIKTESFYKSLAFLGICFGLGYHFLRGIIILLGERLVSYSEHYTFNSLLHLYYNEWYHLLEGVFWYLFILLILLFLYYYQLTHQKEKELVVSNSHLKESSLESMTSRLNPHFLFNAMNNITMLIRKKEQDKAINMTAALSNLLRRTMSTEKGSFTNLNDEVEFLNQYIELEMLRHESINIQLDINSSVGNPRVPQMLLQPLFENSFKHGNFDDPEDSKIELSVNRQGDQLVFLLYNSGFFDSSWNINNNKGLGLHHTVHRLRQIYGSDFTFHIYEGKAGVKFKVMIPYEE